MKLLIVHLSDIHYHAGSNIASERLGKVPIAIQNVDVEIAAVLVIASGDIAFSGRQEEYAIAQRDITNLLTGMRTHFKDTQVHFIAVPGNHDCDFTAPETQTRALLLQGLTRGAPPPDDTTLSLCCAVHQHFFNFLGQSETTAPTNSRQRVYYEYLVPIGYGQVLIRCFNTAFASTKPENPGHMVYPTNLLAEPSIQPTPLYTIAVFHHPYSWLTPETKRQFGSHVEETSDLIFTGHEHQTAYYKKESFSGLGSDYIEGGVFQEHANADECRFNVVVINLGIAQERVLEFVWDRDHFASHDQSSGWRPYRRSKARRDFDLTDCMLHRLEDPGMAFSHPAKPKLLLEDLFVPPNAEEFTVENNKEVVKSGNVESRNLVSTIAERRRVLITGRERSGKSTLAKVLFRHFYNQGFVPVLLEGDHVRSEHASSKDLSKFNELVHSRLLEDYKNPMLDKFDQLPNDRVVLIVDDFDHARLNARGRLKLLENLHRRFPRIVILGDDLLRIEELAYGELGAKVLNDYAQFGLREYGHVLRSAIIDKWYDVNREYATNPDLLDQKVARAERLIDDIMRKSYLPSYPIFILTILQGLDIAQPIDASAGSYGYLYQVLITDRLAKCASEISLDKKVSYLAELGHFMFKRSQRELSEVDFRLFHARYCEEYTGIEQAKIFAALDQAGILEIYDKHYRFKYAYFYYYFVAQYFSRNLENPDVRKSIVTLCSQLQREENANIWLFLTHQSRSDFLLDTIAKHAANFFVETATPAFNDDIKFLQELYDKVPEIVLVNKTPGEMRQERRQQLDDHPEEIDPVKDADTSEDNEAIQMIVRLRAAVRTLEVMGQIVKNFAGSLKSDPRYTLVKGCYELGLRVVGVILGFWQKNGESFVREVLDVVLEKDTKVQNREQLESSVKSCIFYFCEIVATGMVRRISQSVGTKDLADTYRQVLERNPTNSYKLIDIAVKLDNVGFPTGDVYSANEQLKDNVFCQRLLSRLVIEHFYLFATSDKTKQMVCSKLGIKMQDLRGIDVRTSSQKRLPRA